MKFYLCFTLALAGALAGCSDEPNKTAVNADEIAITKTSAVSRVAIDEIPRDSVQQAAAKAMDAAIADAETEQPSSVETSYVPAYDVQNYCKQVSNAVGGSYTIEKGCRDQEYEALSEIRSRNIPSQISKYCNDVGEVVGGSYMIYYGCVIEETKSAAQL